MNSRALAELIVNDVVLPCYDGVGKDIELESDDLEALLQSIEGLLERHAGMKPDPVLEKARKENEGYEPV